MGRPVQDRPDGGSPTFKAVLIIVVLVIVGALILSRTSGGTSPVAGSAATTTTTTTTAGPPASTTTTTLPAAIPASQVKVQVLNGVGTGSYAGEWTAKLKSTAGYVTEPPDNATAKVSSSTIYVLTPGYVAEADALASAVGLPASAVDTTVPPPDTAPIPTTERSTANLVLVVGPDLVATA